MANKAEKDRPGVIMYFDAITTIDKLSDKGAGQFLKACLHYGRDFIDPEFKCDDPLEQVRIETLWEQIKPRIQKDGENWKDSVIGGHFARYRDRCKRDGEEPMEYASYKEWWLRNKERDGEWEPF